MLNMFALLLLYFNLLIIIDIFDRDLCIFYCQLKKWREIAVQSGIALPNVEENMVANFSSQNLSLL